MPDLIGHLSVIAGPDRQSLFVILIIPHCHPERSENSDRGMV